MIVKLIEHRAAEDGTPSPLGDQIQWIDRVERAVIVEHLAEPVTDNEFFADAFHVGTIITAEEREAWIQDALDRRSSGSVPRDRWMVVWLFRDDDRVSQLCLGNGVEAYLLGPDGRNVDRLI